NISENSVDRKVQGYAQGVRNRELAKRRDAMNGEVKQNKTVSPYLLYFVMHTTQTGIGVLGFQVPMVNAAGTDSWLSLLVTGAAFHIVIFMMFTLLHLA